jgi:hypothetical protein
MSVIGCVWGAWRTLTERDGDQAPTYQWCEQQWRNGLAKTAPGDSAIPAWLTQELWSRWRAQNAADRAQRIESGEIAGNPHQLTLSIWGAT